MSADGPISEEEAAEVLETIRREGENSYERGPLGGDGGAKPGAGEDKERRARKPRAT